MPTKRGHRTCVLWTIVFMTLSVLILSLIHMNFAPALVIDEELAYNQLNVDWFRVGPTYNQCFISLLPNLMRLRWPPPIASKISVFEKIEKGKSEQPPLMFEPPMTIGQLELHRKLLQMFSETMFQNAFGDRFMLAAGTLVGSFHHHDFLPWDDEIDIFVDIEIRDEVRQLLHGLEPEYRIEVTDARDKFFTRPAQHSEKDKHVELSQPVPGYSWGWPFVDILYYTRNKTHINENKPAHVSAMSWPVDIVFPLYFRPFGPFWYPAPRNTLAFLARRYGTGGNCYSLSYSHALERSLASQTAPCEWLAYRYPFVQHGPCDEHAQDPDTERMSLNQEKLVIQSELFNTTVIHSLCLAADVSNTRAMTYNFDQADN